MRAPVTFPRLRDAILVVINKDVNDFVEVLTALAMVSSQLSALLPCACLYSMRLLA